MCYNNIIERKDEQGVYKMLKISKEEFCSIVEDVEDELNFIDALNNLNVVIERDNKLISIIIDFLAEKTNDKFEYIDWYLFERTFPVDPLVEINSKTCSLSIMVDSPQKLYELLLLLDEENVYDDETCYAN